MVFNKTVGLKDTWEEKGKKDENSLNNSLKEINRYFKTDDAQEKTNLEKMIGENLKSVENFSLLQQALRKNINNNKGSRKNRKSRRTEKRQAQQEKRQA